MIRLACVQNSAYLISTIENKNVKKQRHMESGEVETMRETRKGKERGRIKQTECVTKSQKPKKRHWSPNTQKTKAIKQE